MTKSNVTANRRAALSSSAMSVALVYNFADYCTHLLTGTDMTSMEKLAPFSDAVESMYDAALDPIRWPLVAEKIATLQGSSKCVMFAVRHEKVMSGFVFTHGIPASDVELWDGRFAREDVWTKAAIEKGLAMEGSVMTSEELLSDDEFLNSTYYREFLAPQNVGRLLCGVIFDGTRSNLPMSACSVYRPRHQEGFESQCRDLHKLLTNHLSKAMGTMFRLRDAELRVASSLAALQRVPSAILLVTTDGRLDFINAAAQHVFDLDDGLTVKGSLLGGGYLSVNDNDLQVQLDLLISGAVATHRYRNAGHFSQALNIRRPSGAADFRVQIAPLGRENEYASNSRDVRAIVFITYPAEFGVELDSEKLLNAFQLTKAEIAVAQEFMRGDSLKKMASNLGLSENTVKTHTRSIFEKTHTHRQAQLMKLLLSFGRAASR